MKTARQPDGKQNSIADLDRNKQGIIASYTRDHRAPPSRSYSVLSEGG